MMVWGGVVLAALIAATLLSGGRPLALAAALTPLPVLLWVGRRIGDLVRHVGVRRRVARDNLRQAFPEKSEAEREAILRDFYRHLGMLLVEFLRAPYLSAERAHELVEFDPEDYRRFEEHRARGNGAIVATAHFGNFELLGSFFARRGLPLTAITKRLPENPFNRFWLEQRRRAGLRELPDSGSIRDALRVLRSGEVLALMIDQNMIPRRAVFAPFFGRLAATTPAPAVLAERTDAPVFLVLLRRLPQGRHRVLIEGPIPFDRSGDPAADRLAFTARLNRALEDRIREAPELWYWIHRRWKTRPPEEVTENLAPSGVA
ncbi:MAG: lysophospholipid acyltransferase family protein [Pseudomonadota bacterium]|nr:MAG: lipid A biosynthesis acyltransferase [Pseudomonadota bacterium]